MRHLILYSILSFLAALPLHLPAIEKAQVTVKEEHLAKPYIATSLYSNILQEQRKLSIYLPESYDSSNKRYPVLFLLDGDRHFFHALASNHTLTEEARTPEVITVAIINGQGTRGRDLARQQENFLDFIEQELLPLINNTYRTLSINTLFGHSLAGFFTVNTWLTRPYLFTHYIAASPVLQANNELAIKSLQEKINHSKSWPSPTSLYLSFGNPAAEGTRASTAFDKFNTLLTTKSIKNVRSLAQHMATQVHMTTPNLTLYQGLTYAFSDYATPIISSQQVQQGEWTLVKLKEYYKNRAAKYNTDIKVPESAYRQLGFALQDNNQTALALETFKERVEQFQSSPRALNDLARAYEELSQISLALTTYKSALTLEAVANSKQNTQYFEEQIKRLNKKLGQG